ncbi:mitochondrial genome maintenance exonuclease 1 [Caerostris extrusa]|uniref:Mitochondrial genome maintenance exonuclease 1 n=1 Tax=Caerostris extrusa TaxID=172846 RepID=A0AAV4XWT7_CAEEX|nr:mitochondrial genome maintenance exonuclease 1 [Caerostris extrusa]
MHVILEDKNISTVMNKLNLEFDALYGALQTPKNITFEEKIKIQDKEFSQNQNEIPFSKLNCNSVPNVGINHNCIKDNLNSILKFPLCKQASAKPELKSVKVELEKRSELYIPSVSKILEKTMSQESIENLQRWKKFMISEMGEEKFQKYQKELLANGQNLHACINEYLSVTPKPELCIEEAIAGHWKSLKAIFPNINAIKLLEERIAHPFLCYKGIVDCLAEYKGHLVVIDWKTSKKKKNFTCKHQHKLSKGIDCCGL